ncbi:MAG: hypothetical protein ABIG39_07665 [Candidatus Micrarchaeota archaeon]
MKTLKVAKINTSKSAGPSEPLSKRKKTFGDYEEAIQERVKKAEKTRRKRSDML